MPPIAIIFLGIAVSLPFVITGLPPEVEWLKVTGVSLGIIISFYGITKLGTKGKKSE